MKNRIGLTLLALLSTPLLMAQDAAARNGIDIPLFSARDLSAVAFEYCATFGSPSTVSVAKEQWRVQDRARITTSGSSTTVTSLGTFAAFTDVAVGDELRIMLDPALIANNATADNMILRYVTARASATSITVNAAVNLGTAGVPFNWRTLTCGTTATSGRIGVDGYRNANFQFEWTTKNATSLDWKVECQVKGSNTAWVVVIPTSGASTNITAVAATSARIIDVSDYDYCRLGMQVNTDTGVNTVNGAVRLTR